MSKIKAFLNGVMTALFAIIYAIICCLIYGAAGLAAAFVFVVIVSLVALVILVGLPVFGVIAAVSLVFGGNVSLVKSVIVEKKEDADE